jgi:hypothetical protein
MSNPILRPNDPRFQRPDVRDVAGNNRFGDENAPADSAPTTADVYAVSAGDDAKPFTPQYSVQQASRASLLLFLGGIGWGAAAVGAACFLGWLFSWIGWVDIAWMTPIVGAGPAGAAWLLAHQELKAIGAGAISSAALPLARNAYWLGLTGLIACIGVFSAFVLLAIRLILTW